MHLALCYVVLVYPQYDVCEHSVGSVYIGWYGDLSASVFRKLCPVSFLVVGECVLGTVVKSGKDVCFSVVFGTLVGVFSVMWG